MNRILALLLALALTGCATCTEHPTACAVAGTLIVGSAAAAFQSRDHERNAPAMSSVAGPNCTTGACR